MGLAASVNGVSEVMHQLWSEQVKRDRQPADERGCGDEEGFGCHGPRVMGGG